MSRFDWLPKKIQQAATLPECFDVRLDLLLSALYEQFLKELLWASFRRNRCTTASVTERRSFVCIGQHQRRISCMRSDLLGRKLIERHPVAESAAFGVRGPGEKTFLGRMSASDSRMTCSREDRYVIAIRGQLFQIRCQLIVVTGFFREEELGQDSHVGLNANHASRNGGGFFSPQRTHGIQKRQRHRNTSAAQKRAAGQGTLTDHESWLHHCFSG